MEANMTKAGVRPVDISSCIISIKNDGKIREFEPGLFMEEITNSSLHWTEDMILIIMDDSSKVQFTVQSFLRKSYRMTGSKIHFGTKIINSESMTCFLGVTIPIYDLASMVEPID